MPSIKHLFKIKEQAYNSALSVLKLSKTYSNERLEIACEIALPLTRLPRYKHLKGILASNQDILYSEQRNRREIPNKSIESSGYIRGADYYGGIIQHGK